MRHFEKTEAEEKTDAGPNIKNDSEMNKGSSTGSDDSNNVVDDNSIDAKTNKNNIEKIDKGSAFMTYIFREWIMPVVIALLIVIFLNKFIFILVTVPTGSMEETIMPGDRLYVNELFDIKNAKRGDILVFKSDELDCLEIWLRLKLMVQCLLMRKNWKNLMLHRRERIQGYSTSLKIHIFFWEITGLFPTTHVIGKTHT